MDTQYAELRELSSSGGGRGGLTKKLIADYYVRIPSDCEEQKAIAAILSDMDCEIETLGNRLKKLGSIKSGMMSELLTGRIRLM
jgi:type I restriction enzyme S subunit